MIFYKCKHDFSKYRKNGNIELVQDELLTEKEFERYGLDQYDRKNHFDKCDISKQETFWIFGVRKQILEGINDGN